MFENNEKKRSESHLSFSVMGKLSKSAMVLQTIVLLFYSFLSFHNCFDFC